VRTPSRAVIAAASLIMVVVLGLGWGQWIPVASMRGEGTPAAEATPSRTASPIAAATPQSTPLPLYTPIPVNEARNVVGRLTIQLTDRGFIPSRFEQAINQPIDFTLVNIGTRRHTFTIDELDVDVALEPGETKTITIPSPRRLGHYTYYSDTPEDRALGMTGTMTIFI
jgi:hypothetical protein